MRTLSASDAKSHFSELLADVERGETVELTRHGRVVAKIVPITATDREEKRRAAIDWILDNKRQGRRTGITIEEIVSARDEGRP
ncbi:type II toxin-antitoxin system prevent-host-death family antitoxin [Mesorhizobium sp. CAU 1732]|uniref:type II toxin-antitoxin system Phd/YefM family antitoxin n=1 Tax=Mesorhizobium sp. CAU 1732 TaxID=3140358 RepID=UPI00325FF28B